jgi:hypothetical protein
MKLKGCYACGKPIPELRMKDNKYSFYCKYCTCATRWKDSLSEIEFDWNEGYVIPEDSKKYWGLVFSSKRG